MIRRISSLLLIAVLTVGVVGCNANNNANRENDTGYNQTNYTGQNGMSYVNNKKDVPRNDQRDMGRTGNRGLYNVNYGGNYNGSEISSTKTNVNSEKYPHTKAILIQDAKYKYIKVDPKDVNKWGQNIQNRLAQRFQQFQSGQQAPNQGQQQGINQEQTNQTQQSTNQGPTNQAPAENQQQAPTNDTGNTNNNAQADQAPAQQTQPTAGISEFAQQVIDLTNEQRKKNGLSALTADVELSNVALKKSQDMQQNNYFSHTSPTYGSPFDMMRDFGVDYKAAGENIAQGQRTPEQVVNAWMNSEGHRANILNKDFTHIGVGFESTGYHWTQMFIGK